MFQGLRNPYTNTNIVLGTRKGYGDFTKALSKNTGKYWNKTNKNSTGKVSPSEEPSGYLFMLGLPNEQTGKAKKELFNGWRACYEDYAAKKKDKRLPFTYCLVNVILQNVFGVSAPDPLETEPEYKENLGRWEEEIWHYATTGTTYPDPDNHITDAGKDWIDKHLCPYYLWNGGGGRRESGKFCKGNCTEQSIEHLAVALLEPASKTEGETTKYQPRIATDYHVLLLEYLFSALSSRMNCEEIVNWGESGSWDDKPAAFPDNNFVLAKEPTSYITIDYHNSSGAWTGALKIVVIDEDVNTDRADTAIFADNGGYGKDGVMIDVQNHFRCVYMVITQTNTSAYPVVWNYLLNRLAHWVVSNKYDKKNPCSKGMKIWGCETEESRTVVRGVKELYNNLKAAMPGLMAYRYQNQIFSEFTNTMDKSIVDYKDSENTIVAKAVPIMDVNSLGDIFTKFTFTMNFEAGRQFSYTHCIVDLNPDYDKYNQNEPPFLLDDGQFPMSFANGVSVNVEDYKTSKLVLQRIDKISGEKFDTFTMGSHTSDYELITDPKKRKYKDDEAIVDGAVDDYAEVTLGNGGSYQRKRADLDLNSEDTPLVSDDMYNYDKEHPESDPRAVQKRRPDTGVLIDDKYESKYYKNKHFFMDPFALTIAQWCYIKLNSQGRNLATKPSARSLLSSEGHLAQIERSYWRYVCVWGEKGEWDYWKQEYVSSRNVTFRDDDDIVSIDGDMMEMRDGTAGGAGHQETSGGSPTSAPIGTTPSDEDELIINFLCQRGYYNPLEDTRPYYYATYNAIRGTGQVYKTIPSGGNTYVMDENKGDEYQLNSRKTTTSFMDILNSKVVYQTQQRVYGSGNPDTVENYVSAIEREMARGKTLDEAVNTIKGAEYETTFGESPLMPYLMQARDDKKGLSNTDRKKYWCSGKEGGINFDLPTEAQWEYCCRDGSTVSVPPVSNLGDTFEENYEPLDLIAWYKFKVIGSKPEPERFCAWRVSKMLFGIGKDKEQINNVYEKEE